MTEEQLLKEIIAAVRTCGQIILNAKSTLDLKAGGSVNLKSDGATNIKGAVIKLN